MEHTASSKVENMEKVKKAIESFDTSFTIGDIRKSTNLNYNQCLRYLRGWCELGLIKYSETTKIYVRV